MNNKYRTLGFDKIYVINLKRRKDRRDKLIKDNPNIDFTFIEAIDGKDLNYEWERRLMTAMSKQKEYKRDLT